MRVGLNDQEKMLESRQDGRGLFLTAIMATETDSGLDSLRSSDGPQEDADTELFVHFMVYRNLGLWLLRLANIYRMVRHNSPDV